MATYSGTPKTWTAGETLLASDFNAEFRDPLAALTGAWTAWTPTVSQGASTNIAKAVNSADYIQVGKFVRIRVVVTMSAAGTSGAAITVSLPVTAAYASAYLGVGAGSVYDATGTPTVTPALTVLNSTTTVALRRSDAQTNTTGLIGLDPSFALASGDIVALTATYEAA